MHLSGAQPNLLTNKLLAGLPQRELDILRPHLQHSTFEAGEVLAEEDQEIQTVYFPLRGMISVVVVMKDGKAIETATIGRDGTFGAIAGIQPSISRARAIVQISMSSMRIASQNFRRAVRDSKPLQELCVRHAEAMLNQARTTAACNALHKVEARFCRWLLQTRDLTESDTIILTQEFLSEMLGVRRTSITDVATKLQSAGAINYSRGVIRITNLAALQAMSCECYETLRDQRAF